MQDWTLMMAPLGITFYFLVYPDQFKSVLAWLAALVQ
jgi:hypothetical protein